jgi:hypothetical protein
LGEAAENLGASQVEAGFRGAKLIGRRAQVGMPCEVDKADARGRAWQQLKVGLDEGLRGNRDAARSPAACDGPRRPMDCRLGKEEAWCASGN